MPSTLPPSPPAENTPTPRQCSAAQKSAKLIKRCSDGGEDQEAEEASWGQERVVLVSFGSRLPRERLSFQRKRLLTLVYSTSTGKVRPGMVKMGQLLK